MSTLHYPENWKNVALLNYKIVLHIMKTEGTVRNRQFRDTGNIGYKTQNEQNNHKKHKRYYMLFNSFVGMIHICFR